MTKTYLIEEFENGNTLLEAELDVAFDINGNPTDISDIHYIKEFAGVLFTEVRDVNPDTLPESLYRELKRHAFDLAYNDEYRPTVSDVRAYYEDWKADLALA